MARGVPASLVCERGLCPLIGLMEPVLPAPLGQHLGLAAAMAAREGEGLVALPYASANGCRLRHSRSWKKKTTVLMAGSISAITPPVSSSPLSR